MWTLHIERMHAYAILATVACIATTGSSMPVLAATPTFARTEEEWAHLQDNVLEWYEIEDLVHEYNATVLSNREDLSKDERRNKDAQEIADYLLDQADDYDALADSAADAVSAASLRVQANMARSSADSNVTDFEVIKLEYEVLEKNIFRNVQNLFLSYYSALSAKAQAESSVAYLERAYASAVNRRNVGMATELDVLTALESLETARAALITADSTITSSRTNLQVLCGWQYDSTPEIGPVPEMDPASIAAISVETDLETALQNSYTLKTDRIKLDNARKNYPNLVEQYESTLQSDTDSFKVSFRGLYDSLVNAGLAYQNTVTEHALKAQDLAAAERRLALGTISAMEYEGVRNELNSLASSEQTAYISMVSAKAAYDAAVRGIL